MKSYWFRLVICVVSHLCLLNIAFSDTGAHRCHLNGTNVYKSGDQLHLKCDGHVGDRKNITIDGALVDPTTVVVTEGRSTNITNDNPTLKDSGVYRCQCHDSENSDLHVLVVEAKIYASTIIGSCEPTIRLEITVNEKDFDSFNLTSFSCPTLAQGNPKISLFRSVTNHLGHHVIHIFAVGKPGEVGRHTCHFTVVYQPNGARYERNFSMTVEETSCVNEIATEAQAHTVVDAPAASGQGGSASRAARCNLQLTALLLLLFQSVLLQLVIKCLL